MLYTVLQFLLNNNLCNNLNNNILARMRKFYAANQNIFIELQTNTHLPTTNLNI